METCSLFTVYGWSSLFAVTWFKIGEDVLLAKNKFEIRFKIQPNLSFSWFI